MKVSSQQVGTGKLGNAIYSKVAGECIARQYNPNVSNPSTDAQVEKRSAFKLLSQLSAILKSDLAIRKEGLKSPRNLFMGANYAAVRVLDGVADINLNKVQITKSNRGLEDFSATRSAGQPIAVVFASNIAASVDRVVYAAYIKQDDGSLVAHDSVMISVPGADGTFAGQIKATDKAVVIYAYGIKTLTGGATAAFGNLVAPTAEQVAKLVTTSAETANGVALTRTKGLTMLEGENSGSSDAEEHFVVSVSASGNGSVSGGGRFVAGQIATVSAVPDAEATFVAWRRGSTSGEVVSTNATYSFEVQTNVTLVAIFNGGPTPSYQISASVSPAGAGTVSGAGTKEEGSQCTLVATPAAGKVFSSWQENGQIVSVQASYTFTVDRARTLVANFIDQPAGDWANVNLANSPWNADRSGVDFDGVDVAGTCSVEGFDHVALMRSTTKPAVGGDAVNLKGSTAATRNTPFSFRPTSLGPSTTWWLVATAETGDTNDQVVAVFDYSLTTDSGE